jgi:hypothetical protein
MLLIILWGKGYLMKKKWTIKAVKEHYQKKIKTLLYELKQSQVVINDFSQTNADLNKYIFELHEAKNQMHKDLQKFCRLYYDTARSYKALLKFQLTAEDLGIKTDYWELPEDARSDQYKFKIKNTLTESGKVVSKAVLTPKKKKDTTDDGTNKS